MVDTNSNDGNGQNIAGNGQPNGTEKIVLYSRSQMFYYWPVWLVALALWALSNMDMPPYQQYYAPIMTGTLFYVITATSVSLRGLWFFMVSLIFVIIGMGLYIGGYVFDIVNFIRQIDLQINSDFYKVLGLPLLAVWILTTFVYDRLRYVVLTPGQLKLVREVGDKQENFATLGMSFTKRRDNLAQHIFLGLGSGDLIIKPGMQQGNNEPIRVNNVLRIGGKISDMTDILALKRH